MKKITNKFIAIFTLTLSLNVQSKVENEVVRSFSVGEQTEFRLENINGAVEITGWNKSEIKVIATIVAKNQKDRDRITIEMDKNGRGLSVETHYKESSGWGSNHSGKVDYEVMVPKAAKLSSIDLVNGSLFIKGVEGKIKVGLVNGSIVATGLASDSDINSVNGSIKVSYSSLAKDLDSISLDTVNGSIKLHLPENIDADVEIETMHGSIKNDFGLSADRNMFSGKNLQGTIGSGDVSINIESVNGGVKLLKN